MKNHLPNSGRGTNVAASWMRAAETAERQKEAERGQKDRKGSEPSIDTH